MILNNAKANRQRDAKWEGTVAGIPRLERGHRRWSDKQNFPALVDDSSRSTEFFRAAVDLGGTRLRVAWVTEKGSLRKWEQPAVPPSQLAETLSRFWKKMKWKKLNRLIVGSKGVWTENERRALQKSLRRCAETVTVISDVELALHGAFGWVPAKKNKILIVAGTGSIALGTDKTGALYRSGGLGPGRGDEGSGYWIGKEFLRRNSPEKKSPRGPHSHREITVTKTAALAKKVIQQSRRHPLCAEIVRSAQQHLADLIDRVHRQMGGKKTVWVSWAGSLMSDKRFRAGVRAFARPAGRGPVRWIEPSAAPAQAAALHPDLIPLKMPNPIPTRTR